MTIETHHVFESRALKIQNLESFLSDDSGVSLEETENATWAVQRLAILVMSSITFDKIITAFSWLTAGGSKQ